MDQLLESKGESGVSMAANLGEEEQSQKGKEVGDQQKEQQTKAKAIEEDDHEDNHEEEEDNEDKTAIERLKNVPKVTNTSKEFYIYITQTQMLLKKCCNFFNFVFAFLPPPSKTWLSSSSSDTFSLIFFPFHRLRFF